MQVLIAIKVFYTIASILLEGGGSVKKIDVKKSRWTLLDDAEISLVVSLIFETKYNSVSIGGAKMGKLQWKRVYDPVEDVDGTRMLIDRLWPRGLKKELAQIDEWPKEISPTTELRRSYHRGEIDFQAFSKAYQMELEENSGVLEFISMLRNGLENGNITLVYGSKNPDQSHVIVLQRYLEEHLK